jgi:N-acyl-D-amino-acid deacylase
MRGIGAIAIGLLAALGGFGQSLLLTNGRVVDGTGKARFAASLRIRNGEIAEIGRLKPLSGDTVLDVAGLIVAPGIIDLQSLSPASIEKEPVPASLVAQGVTTAVLGSDGTGPYSVEDFMRPFDEKPPALNIALLVGYGTIRGQILGPDFKRAATSDEIQRMGELLSDGMKQGAFGLGADLRREPSSFGTPAELMAIAKVLARFGGTLVMNLRDEDTKAADSIKEAIALAREAKVAVHVRTANALAAAEAAKARSQRIDISTDSYTFEEFVKDKRVTIERAMQRMTSAPAGRVALRERGVLRKGAAADVVVFNPAALAAGMKYVFVNGTMLVRDGQLTESRAGQALR